MTQREAAGGDEAALYVTIALVAFIIVPLLGKGLKVVYAILQAGLKFGVAFTIAAIAVGLARDTAPVRGWIGAVEQGLSLVGIARAAPTVAESPVAAETVVTLLGRLASLYQRQ